MSRMRSHSAEPFDTPEDSPGLSILFGRLAVCGDAALDAADRGFEARGQLPQAALFSLVGLGNRAAHVERQEGARWPSDLAPFRPRIAHARLHPFRNQRPFEFRHGANDLEHKAARGCAEIEVVSKAHEGNSQRLEFSQGIDQVPQRPPESVQFPDQDGIEAPPVSLRHEAIQRRPRLLRPGDSLICVFINDPPAAPLRVFLKLADLHLWALLAGVRAHPAIERHPNVPDA